MVHVHENHQVWLAGVPMLQLPVSYAKLQLAEQQSRSAHGPIRRLEVKLLVPAPESLLHKQAVPNPGGILLACQRGLPG